MALLSLFRFVRWKEGGRGHAQDGTIRGGYVYIQNDVGVFGRVRVVLGSHLKERDDRCVDS